MAPTTKHLTASRRSTESRSLYYVSIFFTQIPVFSWMYIFGTPRCTVFSGLNGGGDPDQGVCSEAFSCSVAAVISRDDLLCHYMLQCRAGVFSSWSKKEEQALPRAVGIHVAFLTPSPKYQKEPCPSALNQSCCSMNVLQTRVNSKIDFMLPVQALK